MKRAKSEGKKVDELSVCFTLGYIAGEAAVSTAESVSLPMIGVGCWSFGSKSGEYWGERNQEDIDEIVSYALNTGKRILFDTAEAYNEGRSEECLATALARVKNKNLLKNGVIASKILPQNCKILRKHFEDTLKRLKMKSIDLYQVHWPYYSDLSRKPSRGAC